jgi:hypothetical protein
LVSKTDEAVEMLSMGNSRWLRKQFVRWFRSDSWRGNLELGLLKWRFQILLLRNKSILVSALLHLPPSQVVVDVTTNTPLVLDALM